MVVGMVHRLWPERIGDAPLPTAAIIDSERGQLEVAGIPIQVIVGRHREPRQDLRRRPGDGLEHECLFGRQRRFAHRCRILQRCLSLVATQQLRQRIVGSRCSCPARALAGRQPGGQPGHIAGRCGAGNAETSGNHTRRYRQGQQLAMGRIAHADIGAPLVADLEIGIDRIAGVARALAIGPGQGGGGVQLVAIGFNIAEEFIVVAFTVGQLQRRQFQAGRRCHGGGQAVPVQVIALGDPPVQMQSAVIADLPLQREGFIDRKQVVFADGGMGKQGDGGEQDRQQTQGRSHGKVQTQGFRRRRPVQGDRARQGQTTGTGRGFTIVQLRVWQGIPASRCVTRTGASPDAPSTAFHAQGRPRLSATRMKDPQA